MPAGLVPCVRAALVPEVFLTGVAGFLGSLRFVDSRPTGAEIQRDTVSKDGAEGWEDDDHVRGQSPL